MFWAPRQAREQAPIAADRPPPPPDHPAVTDHPAFDRFFVPPIGRYLPLTEYIHLPLTMPTRTAVHTDKAPPPLPVYSQAIICNGMVYCSGQVGVDPATKQMNQGGVGDRAVCIMIIIWPSISQSLVLVISIASRMCYFRSLVKFRGSISFFLKKRRVRCRISGSFMAISYLTQHSLSSSLLITVAPQKQCLTNLSAVLTEAGSSINNVVKVGVFLTSMDNFAAVNREYEKWFGELKPSRTCVAVHQLPMQTDVEIECIAHL